MLLAWKHELSTILCVGENSDIAKQSKTNEHIARQLYGSLPTNINEKKRPKLLSDNGSFDISNELVYYLENRNIQPSGKDLYIHKHRVK